MRRKKRILNDDIKASKVRLIDEDGEVLGEMSLFGAKSKAREKSLDLMLLSREGDLSIVKMLDYGKFLYRQKKQEQKNKQKGKKPELKIIKITFKIGDHDLEVKKKQAEKFANSSHPLKIMLTLRGRENHYENIARDKVKHFIEMLDDFYKVDRDLVKNGNNFIVMLLPK